MFSMTVDDDALIQIPMDSVPILDLLLRAALCAPHMWDEALDALPGVERDETRDALSQGAWPLPQLTWGWGAAVGEIDFLHSGSQDMDLGDFYEAMNAIAEMFPVQISIPIADDVHDHVEQLPPFNDQRLHLVNRGNWMSFGPPPEDIDDLVEELDESDIPENLPVFTDPLLQIGEQRVGEVWMRLDPEYVAELKAEAEGLFEILICVADAHVRQLRETVRRRQQSLTEEDLSRVSRIVERVSSWQRLLRQAYDTLGQLPPEERAEKAAGVLEISTGHWPPVSVFVSYARDSDAHNEWVQRLTTSLEAMPEFNVMFDGYALHGGKDLTHFMEHGLTSDRIVVVVTPGYVRKATSRIGGVGYESSVISAALFHDQLTDRFVPVLREGAEVPPFLRTKVYVDFRDDARFEVALAELRSALLGLAPVRRPRKQ